MAKNKQKNQQTQTNLHPETRHSIIGIVLFALFLISVLSYFEKAGRLGKFLFKIASALLGSGYFLIPVSLFLTALVFLTSSRTQLYFSTIGGSALFVLSFLGIIEISSNNPAGIHKGGYLGFLFAYPFNYLLGFWSSIILLSALVLASLVITFNFPIKNLILKKKSEKKEKTSENLPYIDAEQALNKKNENEAIEDAEMALKTKEKPKKTAADTNDQKTFETNRPVSALKHSLPPFDILEPEKNIPSAGDTKVYSAIIKKTLDNFGISVEIGEINIGPSVTQYTLKPAQGIKLSRIIALQNDLSLALAAHPIRIEAPIPGRSLVGIELPNKNMAAVRIRSLIENDLFWESPSFLTFVLGKDVAGNPNYADLAKMPHIMIAGSTGSGKSVMIHSIIISLLYRNSPESLRLILIDPKRVELNLYENIPHLLTPVITEGTKAINSLRWAIKEMEQRYKILADFGVRDIGSFNNSLIKKNKLKNMEDIMPYIVIVIDELADLMMTFSREVEGYIVRLTQMARAVGIHLIISTQRPSVEVLTGLIKANITSRIALQTATQVDSRTILDISGAEKLLGKGDMLFISNDTSKPKRIQGCLVTEKEVKKVVSFIRSEYEQYKPESDDLKSDIENEINKKRLSINDSDLASLDEEDELYEEAREIVIEANKASASLLQRRLRIGYARAARILDIMEEKGVIGPGDGAKPREVLIGKEKGYGFED